MEIGYFIKGLVIGFSIAAPIGPIGVLCIQRTLTRGRVNGLVSGLGAATADAIYCTLAAFGITFITHFLSGSSFWIRMIGGVFLLCLGVKIWMTKPAELKNQDENQNLWFAYTTCLFLTLTNPTTLLSFIAVFGGLGLNITSPNYRTSFQFVIGTFLGSALWWVILSSAINLLRDKLNYSQFRWVNILSGAIIFLFGLLALTGLV